MTRTLHIIMPMAGLGSRFKNEHYTLPKPLIPVDGIPMFVKSLSSISNLNCPKVYTFIVRKEHINLYNIDKIILKHFPKPNIIVTSDKPIGAAVDCYRAKKFISKEHSVVFMDCDLYFQSKKYNETVLECLKNKVNYKISGVVLYFNSKKDRYSYALIDMNNNVIRTAEKEVISNHALIGSYFFNDGQKIFSIILKYIEQQLGSRQKEYYLSPLYNKLINKNYQIKACPVDNYFSFGTPEELYEYEKISTNN